MGRVEDNRYIYNRYAASDNKGAGKRTDSNINKPSSVPVNTRQAVAGFNLFGQQQRDRLENILNGAGSFSAYRSFALPRVTADANRAYQTTFNEQFAAFGRYTQDLKNGVNVEGYKGPKSYPEVLAAAENAYRANFNRGILSNRLFDAGDVRGTSVFKAVDFLMSPSNRSGQLTALSADQVRAAVASNDSPNYLVRLVEPKYMDNPDARLNSPNKSFAWVASAEEIAGAKGDLFEIMRRIGYKEADIQNTRQLIASGKKSVSDYALAVIEADAASGRVTPTWDTLLDDVRGNAKFAGYDLDNPLILDNVKNFQYNGMDYDQHVTAMDKTPINDYVSNFPPEQAEAFKIRSLIGNEYGANPLYTGDGTTFREDFQNRGVGGREWFTENNPLYEQQRVSLIPLQDLQLGDNPTVRAQNDIPRIADNPLGLRSEMRSGALIGGAFSAVTSLPEIFNQVQSGDYTGAATTLVSNTTTGAVMGGVSSGAELLTGRGIENLLGKSSLVNRGLERMFESGAARSAVSRLASTESSALTSSAFNSTVRTVAGKVGGAGIVGGVVNGAVASYDQYQAYQRGEVTASQAIGTVVGEAGVGFAAGAAGAAAGAAIGSIIPGAGTVVGGAIGFVAGMVVGGAVDWGARQLGLDKALGQATTALIDSGLEIAGKAPAALAGVRETVGNAVESVGKALNDAGNAVSGGLKSVFGW